MERPDPIRLKVIQRPFPQTRTMIDQRDESIPIWDHEDLNAPDLLCGRCGNLIARNLSIAPMGPKVVRMLPPSTGGDFSVSSIARDSGDCILSHDGPMVVS